MVKASEWVSSEARSCATVCERTKVELGERKIERGRMRESESERERETRGRTLGVANLGGLLDLRGLTLHLTGTSERTVNLTCTTQTRE